MITAEIYAHVLPAVRLLMQDNMDTSDSAPTFEEQVFKRLWAYVTHAVHEVQNPPSSAPEAPAKRDGRSKAWQCVVSFYKINSGNPLLIAETDPETIQGTGSLPDLIEKYAAELHETEYHLLPSPLMVIDKKIPQLRNNLGRQGKASLRIPYDYADGSYLCEVHVSKPGA